MGVSFFDIMLYIDEQERQKDTKSYECLVSSILFLRRIWCFVSIIVGVFKSELHPVRSNVGFDL